MPLKEIARRAGVSHGTLYNLFGTREALIDEVVTDRAAHLLDQVGQAALSFEDAWEGFTYYVEKLCELQAPTLLSPTWSAVAIRARNAS